MMLFLSLLLAHHLADYYLQRHTWIMCKVQHHEKSIGLFYHILVHVGLTSCAFYIALAQWTWLSTFALVFIITTHYAIDIWKTYQTFTARYYIADQLGHFVVLAITAASFIQFYPDLIVASFSFLPFNHTEQIRFLAWGLTLLFLGNPTGISYMVFFRPLTQNKDIGIAENDGEIFNNINPGAIARLTSVIIVGTGQFILATFLISLHLAWTYYQLRPFSKTDTAEQHSARKVFNYSYFLANHGLAVGLGVVLYLFT